MRVLWLAAAVLVFAPVTSAASPVVRIGAATGGEGGRAVFTVRLAKASATPVAMRFATQDGSARSGIDYARRSGTLRFAPGQTVKRVVVRLLDDAEPEASETFTVRLGRRSARGTIRPSDLPGPFTTVARLDASQLPEGNPNATGTATLTFEPQVAQLRYTVALRGLGARAGIPHLHRGAAGAEGPLLRSLTGPSDNDSVTAWDALPLTIILQIYDRPDEFYLDVHTAAHPSGAIRGQLEHATG